jgi:Zn-dependent peptidase ImmA (M78 family)/transcriptional regulator with XRE-family HTH domain
MEEFIMSLSKKLSYARDFVNLTLAKVCEKTGIGESSLSEFENGKREPSLSQLMLLAKAYGRPESFFLSDEDVPVETILWREKPEQAREIELNFLQLCRQYHQVEMWAENVRQENLPNIGESSNTWNEFTADSLADQVHQTLALGDYPARNLLSVLEERCYVKIFHLDFEPSGTAAAIRSKQFGSAILLNQKNKRWRRHFDLAHELFHLLTWNVFRHDLGDDSTSVNATDIEEKLANRFAASLLIPAEALKQAILAKYKNDELPFAAVYDIARQFDVSIDALIWRINDLRWLPVHSHNDVKSLIEQIKKLSEVFEIREDTKPPQWPDRYKALTLWVYRQGGISTGKVAEFLKMSRKDAMRYIEPEGLDNEKVSVTNA